MNFFKKNFSRHSYLYVALTDWKPKEDERSCIVFQINILFQFEALSREYPAPVGIVKNRPQERHWVRLTLEQQEEGRSRDVWFCNRMAAEFVLLAVPCTTLEPGSNMSWAFWAFLQTELRFSVHFHLLKT